METKLFEFAFFGHIVAVTGWKLLGSIGALMFSLRWVVQFMYTRRAGRPVTPLMFWVMSLIGSVLTLAYFIFSPKQDMVGILGNFLPCFVALYNLILELQFRGKDSKESKNARESNKDDDDNMVPLVINTHETAAGE